MRRWIMMLLIAASFAFAAPIFAASTANRETASSDTIWLGGYGHLYDWRAVSRDELILWSSPSRPYLVKIWRPHTGLRFAESIGVTSTVGRITKFDSVIVGGQRLPIISIVALDREIAKSMRWTKKQL